MATLTGQSIASSYEQLLHVDRDGGGNGSTLVDIKDGDNGTTFALKIATDNIEVDGKTVLDKEVPFIAIPKPYDLGVFANVATGIIDGMYKRSDGVTKKYVAESISQITPGLPIPAGVRPFIEMMFNKNFYSGAPVIGLYELQR